MIKQKKSFLDKIAAEEEDTGAVTGKTVSAGRSVSGSTAQSLTSSATSGLPADLERSWQQAEADGQQEEEEEGQLAIDVYQDDDTVFIKSIIGGVRPEDLDLTVKNDMVTIKGSRSNSMEIASNDYYYQECFWGSFSRSVILPCDIKVDEVEASMKNGILTIKMPKAEKYSTTKIRVIGE